MHKTALLLLAAALLALLANPASACEDGHAPVGYVVRGPIGDVKLERDGQRIPPTVGRIACDGDILSIGAGGALYLKTPSNPNASYGPGVQVLRAAGGDTWFGAVINVALGVIAPAAQPYSDQSANRGADNMGCDFTSSALLDHTAVVDPGWRSIVVRWRCGPGRFSLSLQAPNGTTITAEPSDETAAVIPTGPLAPGRWRVQLTGPGRTLNGEFVVDARQPVPRDITGPSSELENAAAAILLASRPELEFEAEQIFSHSPEQGIDRPVILRAIACKAASDAGTPC